MFVSFVLQLTGNLFRLALHKYYAAHFLEIGVAMVTPQGIVERPAVDQGSSLYDRTFTSDVFYFLNVQGKWNILSVNLNIQRLVVVNALLDRSLLDDDDDDDDDEMT